ncbi:MAG: PilZ domain-containing protein [Planctomycetes bacterium]|nr:PilZ domain-containing protein [Planctomycetota bacterium]
MVIDDIKALRRVLDRVKRDRIAGGEWPDAKERRASPRILYGAQGQGSLTHRDGGLPLDVGDKFPVLAVDLSRGGACFLCNHELQEADQVTLIMPTRDGGSKRLVVHVLRCRRAGLNAFVIGGEFIGKDEPSEPTAADASYGET